MDRALGNPLGNPLGLARSGVPSLAPEPLVVDITSGAGEYVVPAGYRFVRIIAVGAGSSGVYYNSLGKGGGGGAVAKTLPIPLNGRPVTISYEIGMGGVPVANGFMAPGGDTLVKFLGYDIVAGGGRFGGTAVGIGGTATGGDFNYAGSGAGQSGSAAGGAAGLFGGGYDPLSACGGYGASATGSNGGGGGGGIDGHGGRRYNNTEFLVTWTFPQISPKPEVSYRTFPGTNGNNGVLAQKGGDGGAWGGGGGAAYSSTPENQGKGGNGGLRIELW